MFNKIYFLLVFALVLSIACEKSGPASSADNLNGGQTGKGGSLARFAINGNYLYSVDAHNISIIDIADPRHPFKLETMFAGYDIETIFIYKNKLYLGASNGMYIYSLDNPAKPVKEGEATHFRACDPVVSNDSVSYVTLRSGGGSCGSTKDVLNVYDVKNAKNPSLVKEVILRNPYGLGISNGTLYVCEGQYGMVTFDISDAYNPVKKTEYDGETFYDVIPYGDVLIAFIEKGVCFFDISNPASPVLLSKLKNETI